MAEDLSQRPEAVVLYEHRSENGIRGPALWHIQSERRSAERFERPAFAPEQWSAKENEYLELVRRIRALQRPDYAFNDRKNGVVYVQQDNPVVASVVTEVIHALARYVAQHAADEDFFSVSATAGMLRLLSERPELVADLRLAQELPRDGSSWEVAVDRPATVGVVEAAIGVIPVVGTVVALYEAYSGRDLFEYRLTPLERGALAAFSLVPTVARFVKGGRVLYTAARLEALYGPPAARWNVALAVAERVELDPAAVRTIAKAEAVVRSGAKMEPQVARELGDALSRLGLRNAGAPRTATLGSYLSDALNNVISAKAFLGELDELALHRVIEKGPNVSLMKGQLLEELLESRIAKWLRDPAGAPALGISRPGRTLEFIPGHLVRDADGRQITDGMLGYREGGVLKLVAIFEAKSGSGAARELRLTAGVSVDKLPPAARAELRAYARDVMRSRAIRARRAGEPFPTKPDEIEKLIDEIERKIARSELGGQVTRDIERLHENADGTLVQVVIGGERAPVQISPTRTRVFGLLPKDVKPGAMAQTLKDQGYSFEVFGMNVTEKELVELSVGLRALVPPQLLFPR
jgi:hypothetical protein